MTVSKYRLDPNQLPELDQDLSKCLDHMKDEEIDYSDIPELDDSFFKHARSVEPKSKKTVTLRLDQDVFDWFKGQGKGHLTRMNTVLKAYMLSHLKHDS